ncbi:MAG TPA: GNAT family N-acetyltransferase [Lacunisphaera sp.]|nr:GNAT family N-acetyltransferase [Lacunisphaera sp.]
MPIVITAERPDTPDATALVTELEDHLAARYPAASRHGLSVERLINEGVAFFVLRADGHAAGCGGIKLVDGEFGELKRMYVRPQFRGAKFGEMLIERLAAHARAQGIGRLRLETGIHQTAAIRLYERVGFHRIPPFPPYRPDPLSQCFEKSLAAAADVQAPPAVGSAE